jgi:hypothetical protein
MDLAFPAGLILIVFLAVLITGQVAGDGRSDWLKGVQLLLVYLVLALTFFFLPSASPHWWRSVKNSKVGIPTTAGELAARYSTLSLNNAVVPGSESITGAIYGVQQQFVGLDAHEIAGQRFETLAVRAQAAW